MLIWQNVCLVPGKYRPSNNVSYVREFLQTYQALFEKAPMVLVERQMRCNMRILEALLEFNFAGRCIVVAPRAVKMHFNVSRGSYSANKDAAVRWAQEFVNRNPSAFAPSVPLFCGKKRDDLADALLLIMYYLDTYSNQRSVSDEPTFALP